MNRIIRMMFVLVPAAVAATVIALGAGPSSSGTLPPPALKGSVSLEEAMAARRSVRRFTSQALSIQQISQLCWAGQGITESTRGLRTCPSAGGIYPLELYIVTAEGVDRYRPVDHSLERHRDGDMRPAIQGAAVNQTCVGSAAATFVIAAVASRTEKKYGDRAMRYIHMEAGHCGQNILLEAIALGLGAVPVGAFSDDAIAKALSLPPDHAPLYLIPVGYPQARQQKQP